MNNNLLIIGAGGHGHCVKETAESLGSFNTIGFLDDIAAEAIGRWDDYSDFSNSFSHAFVALGNNELRSVWFDKLTAAGFIIPTLVHPTTYVSPSAEIENGTIVLPKAVIHTNVKVCRGSIIGIGTLLDHDVKIKEFCHVDSGSILKGILTIKKFAKVEAGSVINFNQTAQDFKLEVSE